MGQSFAEMHPELASEFSERNLPLTVSDITYDQTRNTGGSASVDMNGLQVLKADIPAKVAPIVLG
jgi:hypothetical protein